MKMNLLMIRRKNYKKIYNFLIDKEFECCYEQDDGIEKIDAIELPEEFYNEDGSLIRIEHKNYSILELNWEIINNTNCLMLITEKNKKYLLCKMNEDRETVYYMDKSIVDRLIEFMKGDN